MLHISQSKEPLSSSGLTSDVRVTVPEMVVSLPTSAVFKSRSFSTCGQNEPSLVPHQSTSLLLQLLRAVLTCGRS